MFKNTKDSKSNWSVKKILLLLLCTLITLPVLFLGKVLFSGEPKPYYTTEEWNNKFGPTNTLAELQWNNNPTTIYYLASDSNSEKVFSKNSDGSNNQLIYPNHRSSTISDYVSEYFLLDKTKNLLIFTEDNIVMTDQFGQNAREILSIFDDTHVGPLRPDAFAVHPRLSPDQNWLVFIVDYPFDPEPRPSDDVYFVNLKNYQVTKLDQKNDLFNEETGSSIESIYWLKDSNKFIISVNKDVQKRTHHQVILYDINSKTSQKLGEDNNPDNKRRALEEFIDQKLLAFPPDNLVTMNKKGEKAEIKYENYKTASLFLNDKKILTWDKIHPNTRVFFTARFLPDDEHIVLSGITSEIRIVEPSTGKTATFVPFDQVQPHNLKWFGQETATINPSD